MRLAVRVLGPVLVLLALLFAWPATASASGPPTGGARHVCAYDAAIYDAPANYAATERGPPVAGYDRDFAHFADGHRSNGASARLGDLTTLDTYDYDATSTLMQVDNNAGTTSVPAAATSLAFSPLQRWRVAAKGGEDTVQLFRHASPEELADLKATGTFNLGPNSTGKYFAENAGDAGKWGAWLNKGQGGIVSTRVPRSFADQMMRWEKLDGIGPARFASPEQLDVLNRVMSRIEFW